MELKKVLSILFIAAIVLLVLGLLTLVPSPGASKPSLLGYKAKCSFTPVSTLILFWMALVLYTIRARLMNESGILGSFALLIVLSIVFLAGIIFYSFRYAAVNAKTVKIGSNRVVALNTGKSMGKSMGPKK